MTHPFHPLRGRRFELLTYRKTWGEDRVFFEEGGRLRALPADWTDVPEPLIFVTLAAGRAHFRPDDLLRLAELVEGQASLQAMHAQRQRNGSGTVLTVSGKLRRVCKKKNAASAKPRRRERAQNK